MERGNRLGRCLGKEARTCHWGKGREEVGITCPGSRLRTGGAVHSPHPPLHLGEVDELFGGMVCENAEMFRRHWLT